MTTVWALKLTDKKPTLSLNVSINHFTENAERKRLRREVATLCRAYRLPKGLQHVHTVLEYIEPDKRRRDEDNIVAYAKPLWDGLVDYGVVKDDDHTHMTKIMPRILPKGSPGPPLRLLVWEAPPPYIPTHDTEEKTS